MANPLLDALLADRDSIPTRPNSPASAPTPAAGARMIDFATPLPEMAPDPEPLDDSIAFSPEIEDTLTPLDETITAEPSAPVASSNPLLESLFADQAAQQQAATQQAVTEATTPDDRLPIVTPELADALGVLDYRDPREGQRRQQAAAIGEILNLPMFERVQLGAAPVNPDGTVTIRRAQAVSPEAQAAADEQMEIIRLAAAKNLNPPTPSFLEKIQQRWRLGRESASDDQLAYRAMMGEVDWNQVKGQLDPSQEPQRGGNWFSEGFLGAVQMLPAMVDGIVSGTSTGLQGAMAGGTAAAIAGQLGPQALAPEEILTVPAAAAAGYSAGQAAGSSQYWYKQGAGSMYHALRKEGIPHEIASNVSAGFGAPYAGIELAQVTKLVPGLKQTAAQAVAGGLKKRLTALAVEKTGEYATQIGQETLQEANNITGEALAEWIAGVKPPPEKASAWDRIAGTIKQSALSIPFLMAPKGVVDTVKTVRGPAQQYQPPPPAPVGTPSSPTAPSPSAPAEVPQTFTPISDPAAPAQPAPAPQRLSQVRAPEIPIDQTALDEAFGSPSAPPQPATPYLSDSSTPSDTPAPRPALSFSTDAITPEQTALATDFSSRLTGQLRTQGILDTASTLDLTPVNLDRVDAGAPLADFIDNFSRLTGTRIQFVKASDPTIFGGAVRSDDAQTIYLNADSQRPVASLIGHEYGHTLQYSNPALYKDLRRVVATYTDSYRTRARESAASPIYRTGPATQRVRTQTAELTNNTLGDAFLDPEFWRSVQNENRPLIQKLWTSFNEWVDSLLTRQSQATWGTPQFATDLTALRRDLAKTIAPALRGKENANATEQSILAFSAEQSTNQPMPEDQRAAETSGQPSRGGLDAEAWAWEFADGSRRNFNTKEEAENFGQGGRLGKIVPVKSQVWWSNQKLADDLMGEASVGIGAGAGALPTKSTDIDKFVIYRGEKNPPSVKRVIATVHGDSSRRSESTYPVVELQLSNGTVLRRQIRISGHDQVSQNSPYHYSYDVRWRGPQMRGNNFATGLQKAIAETLDEAIFETWSAQKNILEKANPDIAAGAAGIKTSADKSQMSALQTGSGSALQQNQSASTTPVNPNSPAPSTGAVDLAAEPKPRSFPQTVAAAPGVAPEVKAQLTALDYDPISNAQTVATARARIDAAGSMDSAVTQFMGNAANPDFQPTAVDYATGIELLGQLQSRGRHADAASIADFMARAGTTQGQAIQALSLISRLTPAGIEAFAASQITRAARNDPKIEQLIQDNERLRAEIATAKRDSATAAIVGRRAEIKTALPAEADPVATNIAIREAILQSPTPLAAQAATARILQDNGLSEKAAIRLAEGITKDFLKTTTDTRAKVLQDLLALAETDRRFDKGKVSALIRLNREGKLTDSRLHADMAKMLGIPAWTAEHSAKVQALLRQREAATDPRVKLVKAAEALDVIYRESMPAGMLAKIDTFQTLMMLLNPKTWIRNIGGNAFMFGADLSADTVAWSADAATSIVTGKRTRTGLDIATRISALGAGLGDIRAGYEFGRTQGLGRLGSFKEGVQTLIRLGRLYSSKKYDSAEITGFTGTTFQSGIGKVLEDTLGAALSLADRGFYESAFRASLDNRMRTAAANGTPLAAPDPEMIAEARMDASRAIYQDDNRASKALSGLRKVLNESTTRSPRWGLGSMLIKFSQVPGSILMRGIEFSPLGFIRNAYQLLAPALNSRVGFDQKAFTEQFSRALVGTTGLVATGYWLAQLGIISAGANDEDQEKRNLERAQGWGSYRLNVSALKRALMTGNFWTRQPRQDGDVVVNYDWAQPLSISVAMGAYARENQTILRDEVLKGKQQSLLDTSANWLLAAGGSITGAMNALVEQPLLKGLNTFFKRAAYGDIIGAVVATAAEVPGTLIPTAVRQWTQLSDNTVRETRDSSPFRQYVNELKTQLPGLSQTLPAKFDITGQPIERYQRDSNTVFNVLFNPSMVTYIKKSPILTEMSKVYAMTGEPRAVANPVKRDFTIEGVKVRLTTEEISALQQDMGALSVAAVEKFVLNDPRYDKATWDTKAKAFTRALEKAAEAAKYRILLSRPDLKTRAATEHRQMLQNRTEEMSAREREVAAALSN